MARARARARKPPAPAVRSQGYATLSMRPLHILVFMLPMIVFYEVGSAVALSNNHGMFETIKAHHMIYRVFENMGVTGVYPVYLPGIFLVAVLLVWHYLERDRWEVRWPAIGVMAVESVIWTLPLLVLLRLAYRVLVGPADGGALETITLAAGSAPASAADGSILARLTIAIGAGLYEEMLFRFALIALLHTVLVNLLAMKEAWGWALSIALSSFAFAFYHDVSPASGRTDWGLWAYYALAGLYFGVLYRLRGLGIVVAVHALYDVVVLLLRGDSGS